LQQKTSCDMKQGPTACVSIALVIKPLKQMKAHKAPGISGVVAEMLKVADVSIQWLTELCNDLMSEGCIPSD